MRLMGLDFGSKTVGVAVSDELKMTATGVEIVRRESPNKLRRTLARIGELLKKYDVNTVILGYPVMLDGSEGERVEKTKEFAQMKLWTRWGLRKTIGINMLTCWRQNLY